MSKQPVDTKEFNELELISAAVGRMEVATQTLISQSRAHRSENVTLHGQLAAAEKKLSAAENQVRQISETANALQKKVDEWKHRCEELEHQSRLTATDLERTRLAMQTRESEMQGLTDSLAESQREVERRTADADTLREERNEARRAMEAMEHESGSYASLIAQRDSVIAAREEEVNQLATQLEQGSAQIAELKQTLEHSRSELAQLSETNGNGAAAGVGPLFSDEEREKMTLRIKDIVGKLDRYLA